MSDLVLIVASDEASASPVAIARSLGFRSLVVHDAGEAVACLSRQSFRVIAATCELAGALEPLLDHAVPLITLDDPENLRLFLMGGDGGKPGSRRPQQAMIEAVSTALLASPDFGEVLRRLVVVTAESFAAERVEILNIGLRSETDLGLDRSLSHPAEVSWGAGGTLPFSWIAEKVRASSSKRLPAVRPPDSGSSNWLMVQAILPAEGALWALVVERKTRWKSADPLLLSELSPHITIVLSNLLLSHQVHREQAKLSAI